MKALPRYVTLVAFQAAIIADVAIDKYLFVGVLLYGPSKLLPNSLSNTTPVISAPVLTLN